MHFNTDGLVSFAEGVGDQEGRLTYKSPPKTLYDSAYKERWFKLKANLLFYYRLNEFGGVEKNEPSGVFVLENIEVKREDGGDVPFGFAIKWKDDSDKKHLFFATSEANSLIWINKLTQASYEHLRAQMIKLRVQIRNKTGKDPLEHLGTPLIQRASRSGSKSIRCKSQFHVNLEVQHLLQTPPKEPTSDRSPERGSPTRYSLPLRSPHIKVQTQKSRSLIEPIRAAPLPPPRKGKKQNAENGHVIVTDLLGGLECKAVDGLVPGIGRNTASFQCHLDEQCLPSNTSNLLD